MGRLGEYIYEFFFIGIVFVLSVLGFGGRVVGLVLVIGFEWCVFEYVDFGCELDGFGDWFLVVREKLVECVEGDCKWKGIWVILGWYFWVFLVVFVWVCWLSWFCLDDRKKRYFVGVLFFLIEVRDFFWCLFFYIELLINCWLVYYICFFELYWKIL